MGYQIENFASTEMLDLQLRHKCICCGKCCKWKGNVFLYPNDISRLIHCLDISQALFLRKYCYLLSWNYDNKIQYRVCLNKRNSLSCVFLKNNRCKIHSYKPLVCKAGPAFWHFITDKKLFSIYYSKCPGFQNRSKQTNISVINTLFMKTWKAEINAFKSNSFDLLAEQLNISLNELKRLPKIKLESLIK